MQTLRVQDETSPSPFGLPQLDRLLQAATESRLSATKTRRSSNPILELTSVATGGGKTHLLYYLVAIAALPVCQGGKGACAIILDTDGTFCAPRLAQQIRTILIRQNDNGSRDSEDEQTLSEDHLMNVTLSSLTHVHIFRPQSLPSTIATLDTLPTYLFNKSLHHSIDRPVGFIALDSASAFYWQHRAEEEEAAFLTTTTTSATDPDRRPQHSKPDPEKPTYTHLTTALKTAATTFSCPLLLTTQHHGPAPNIPSRAHIPGAPDTRSLRPTSLPAPLAQLPTLRLILQRIPVRKFPPGIGIAEAQREARDRLAAVEEGKFEAVVNEWGIDERTLARLQREGAGFGFRVVEEGVVME